MPNRCVAAGCSNSAQDGISVFTFPKDPELKKKWTTQVKRTRDCWKGPSTYSVLCSAHFTEDCFEPDIKLYQSFGLKKTRQLKPGAVPSIFKRQLETSVSATDQPSTKKKRTAYEKREDTGYVVKLS